MRLCRFTPRDAILAGLSVAHLTLTLTLALTWRDGSAVTRFAGLPVVVLMTVYNIIVISHVFTHQAWFRSPFLNRLVSMLNSLNIAQSVKAYELFHVRNHHRYHNDRKRADGTTGDFSSTFRDGEGDDHAGLLRYAFWGAATTLLGVGRALLSVLRLWRVGGRESELRSLLSRNPLKRRAEQRQIQLDRMALSVGIVLFLALDWQWAVFVYLPALYLSFALVNVQNYYEHYGASPEDRYANSVSYYGRLYNLLTFNDGYHQEHHLSPQAHWSRLPQIRAGGLSQAQGKHHLVSPVPALLGFLHRGRAVRWRERPAVRQVRRGA
ncbi:MAG TPA: fatty acid desaturase [Acidobacteriota bacterium]|nr:fatty acid desaturase [Acidobacteriota bacterium]